MRSMNYDLPTYLICGAVAIFLSWTLSGCRLGNNVVPAGSPDTVSGYYETQAQRLTFCATQGKTETCKDVSATQTPSLIGGTMSNPVGLLLTDPDSGYSVIFNPQDTRNQLGILVFEDMSLYNLIWSGAFTLWDTPTHRLCNSKQALESSGTLVQGNGPFTSGSKHPLSGRIQLTHSFNQIFLTNCDDTLAAIANCYRDANQCEGASTSQNLATQAEWQAMFAPYVQAGVMTAADIPSLSAISYKVSYQ